MRRNDHLPPIGFLLYNFCKSELGGKAKGFANSTTPEIAINQESLGTGKGKRNSEVGGNGRFTFTWDSARDQERFRPWPLIRHEENRRADVTVRFRKHVTSIVWQQKRDLALHFFFWNLAQHIFGKE